MDANPFLDYLYEHAATERLAEALTDIVNMRRALAVRRMIPIPIEASDRRTRVAS